MLNWSAWLEAQGQPPVRLVAQVGGRLWQLGLATGLKGLAAKGGSCV